MSSEALARRIESQAMISAVPGQLAELEQIAREVRALGDELERLRKDQAEDDEARMELAREIDRLRPIEQRAREMAGWPDRPEFRGPYASAARRILGEAP